jgi:2-(1,2-epoxy-1,2-dihydrophenyl)acetyl-CoA isomerase
MESTVLEPFIIASRNENVLNLNFNRPKSLNAINSELAKFFLAHIQEACNDPSLAVIVISGTGPSFMAGGDIAQFQESPESIAQSLIVPMNAALAIMRNSPQIIVAAVHGPVAGAGMSLALASDLVIAADDTRFNFAYSKLAVSGDLGITWTLPHLVGVRRALSIALLGDTIAADEALQLGLANQVVSSADMDNSVISTAMKLSKLAPVARKEIKRLMYQGYSRSFEQQLDDEKHSFSKCTETKEFKEAVHAFLSR